LEPVAKRVRVAAASQAMDAREMVMRSLAWVETGGRRCAAAAVAA
jgi:hypothetical protein